MMTDKASATTPGTQAVREIKGHTAITKTIARGLFVCPAESTERAFWHRRIREWTTLFSIPVIPGQVVEEFVECFCCGATADPRILTSTHPALRPSGDARTSRSTGSYSDPRSAD